MAGYYTAIIVTLTNAIQTFTHNLSVTPSLLVGRLIPIAGAVLTATAPAMIAAMGTNVVGVASGPGTTQTCILEVQQIHSLIGGV